MANVQHSSLPNADLHEPKGVSTATTGQIAHASSSAVSWEFPEFFIHGEIIDVSTAGSSWTVSPYAGTIDKIYTIIDGVIATADAAITFELGGTLITNGSITVANAGSAAGDVDSSTPSANKTVTAGQAIELITDGASTNTVKAKIVMILKRTS